VLPLNCGLSDNGVVGRNATVTLGWTRDGKLVNPHQVYIFSIDRSGNPRGFSIGKHQPGQPTVLPSIAADQNQRLFVWWTPGSAPEESDFFLHGCEYRIHTRVWGKFQDVPWGRPFFDDIYWMLDRLITQGFDDDTFKPQRDVSRQVISEWLWRAAGSPNEFTPVTYADVRSGHTFHNSISWMTHHGLAQGYADGRFGPKTCMTRAALASVLHRWAGSPGGSPAPAFADLDPSSRHYDAIGWAVANDVVRGYGDGTYRPGSCIQRQHAAAMLHRYLPA
jgi:hypothetical protein